MGCDIHLFTEVKAEVADGWTMIESPDTDRDYELFEKMAGVRGDESNAIAKPRGLPNDTSDGTRLHYRNWEGDARSTSYLTFIELLKLKKWYDKRQKDPFNWYRNFGYAFGDGIDGELPEWVENIRVVFWFDN